MHRIKFLSFFSSARWHLLYQRRLLALPCTQPRLQPSLTLSVHQTPWSLLLA